MLNSFTLVLKSIFLVALMSLIAAIAMRFTIGPNYNGVGIIDDLRINLSIVWFFIVASGFIVTYPYKWKIWPTVSVQSGVVATGLFFLHATPFTVWILNLPRSQAIGFLVSGVLAILTVELVLVAFCNGRKL